jgi:hypothetical protein
MKRELTADFETLLNRLKTRNAQLDRQIEAALKSEKIGREALALAPATLDRQESWRVNRVEQQLDHALNNETARQEWERISRPSVTAISRTFNGQLLRA